MLQLFIEYCQKNLQQKKKKRKGATFQRNSDEKASRSLKPANYSNDSREDKG